MIETQRTSEITLCLHDFFLDVEATNRTGGTIRFHRQKLESFLAILAEQERQEILRALPTANLPF